MIVVVVMVVVVVVMLLLGNVDLLIYFDGFDDRDGFVDWNCLVDGDCFVDGNLLVNVFHPAIATVTWGYGYTLHALQRNYMRCKHADSIDRFHRAFRYMRLIRRPDRKSVV